MSNVLKVAAVSAGVAAAETDANFNQTVLLLHGDGTNGAQNNTFLDGSTNNFTITRNGNTTQGTFSPFSAEAGKWSNFFDGTGDFLTTASSTAFAFGTGDFTMEAWIYSQSTAIQRIISIANIEEFLVVNNSGLELYYFDGTTNFVSGANKVPLNSWNHVAVSRSSGTIRLFINGVLVNTPATSSSNRTTAQVAYIGRWANGNNDPFLGYISNARVVKGTAVYTSAFTPSTTPLTAITNTSLLTCQSNRFVDNSTNAFAITRNGDVRVTPFSPFAPSAAYDPAVNGGSGLFLQSGGAWLAISDASNLASPGSGDFTLEAWVYLPSAISNALSASAFYHLKNDTGTSTSVIIAEISSGGAFNLSTGSALIQAGTAGLVRPGQWNHLVASRVSGTIRTFVNGAQDKSFSNTTTYNGSVVLIGVWRFSTSTFSLDGYVSDLRFVKGSGVTSVTVPTAPLTAITNTSLLLNFTNAGILDNTGKNNLETVGNAQIDTTTKKYGTGSMEFDGTGDWLLIPSTPDLNLGTGAATIECWLYITAAIQDYRMIVSENSTNNYVTLRGGGTGGRIEINVAGTAFTINLNNSISQDTWHHLAVVRSGSTFTAYVDGVSLGTGTSSAQWNYSTNGTFVGRFGGVTAYEWPGYIDDLRITKGVARYTANFTAPTKAFPDQ
jgi:hypothetical protein